ncbi:uncharacterized protein BDR25DRAFT_353960 [Lindgomyces ingoldianus]|uniref:Uncharacterized protein n=1 Tax=Lindgomyces ingoldianus TaxID=673940 RepID=A0ACB6QZJ2_9PLEO|nr:uncharacterized protein BDR25DRAFT_353960 [Lindgomyces ingoldianus]KAF2472260.1 hypothetical protein BDR25DRAFT_353960 [Lindgomyces ingoldianus]
MTLHKTPLILLPYWAWAFKEWCLACREGLPHAIRADVELWLGINERNWLSGRLIYRPWRSELVMRLIAWRREGMVPQLLDITRSESLKATGDLVQPIIVITEILGC